MPTFNFNKPFKAGDDVAYKDSLDALSAKLQSIQKNITYLDTYNITSAVSSEHETAAAISLLTPGSALVINTQYSFMLNDEQYRTGDVVLRIATGEYIHIQSQVGGLYYPHQLEEGDSGYKITYAFTPSVPDIGNSLVSKEENTQTVVDLKQTIEFELKEKEDQAFIYGIYDETPENGKFSFPIQSIIVDGVSKVVRPLIKFFIVDVNAGSVVEELNITYKLTQNTDNWDVELIDDFSMPTTKYSLWYLVK